MEGDEEQKQSMVPALTGACYAGHNTKVVVLALKRWKQWKSIHPMDTVGLADVFWITLNSS
eukprot:m.265059 g.265059  ORF g.265059 m.265059 type:complete len:61 (+) comp59769_c0_seq1:424-606(+)